MLSLLRHLDNERQPSVHNVLACISGNQGIVWIFQIISELLTALVVYNTKHRRENIDSKIIDIVTCKAFHKGLLDVE